MHEDGLLSRFLEFFSRAARRSSWTLKLPDLKNKPTAHALRSSLRAISLAYFAHVTKDQAIQVESFRHYGYSLARQRLALASLPKPKQTDSEAGVQNQVDIESATNTLLATVILSYFELICPTTPNTPITSSAAYVNHSLAAEQIILLLGPQALSNDIIAQLFFSIRSHAVYRAAVLGKYTEFSEKKWLDAAAQLVPKQSYARSAYDRVTEWVLRLSRLRLRRWSSGEFHSEHGVILEGAEDEADTPATLLADLQDLYKSFLRVCRNLTIEDVPLFMTLNPSSDPSSTPAEVPTSPSAQSLISIFERQTNFVEEIKELEKDTLVQQDPLPIECMTTGVLAEGPANLLDQHPVLQKQFAGTTTAYYHTAAILMQTYLAELKSLGHCPYMESLPKNMQLGSLFDSAVQGERWYSEYGEGMAQSLNSTWDPLYNARIILSAGQCLSPEGKSNGTAVMRMMLPFSVVWHFCRDVGTVDPGTDVPINEDAVREEYVKEADRVRLEARQAFEQWCTREGMSGLMGVAFEDIT